MSVVISVGVSAPCCVVGVAVVSRAAIVANVSGQHNVPFGFYVAISSASEECVVCSDDGAL